jgi:hypothetical protein
LPPPAPLLSGRPAKIQPFAAKFANGIEQVESCVENHGSVPHFFLVCWFANGRGAG